MIELQADRHLLAELQESLSMHPAAGDVLVSRRTLQNALLGFAEGRFGAEEIVRWASLLEAYDQVIYEAGLERKLASLVFRLASPEINETLDQVTCQRMLEELRRAA